MSTQLKNHQNLEDSLPPINQKFLIQNRGGWLSRGGGHFPRLVFEPADTLSDRISKSN